jgi:hypothetical protein
MKQRVLFLSVLVLAVSQAEAQAPVTSDKPAVKPPMGFFITSANMGDGGNLGGLKGADAHCQKLAEVVGSKRTWRAYLSTQATADTTAINAHDRIGKGPWHNANGYLMASSVDDLHYNNAAFGTEFSLTEKGDKVLSRAMGDAKGQHDILSGSNMDGTAIASDKDATCSNWTSNDKGAAMVGHHDRRNFAVLGASWNSVHLSRSCSAKDLEATGGEGLFYCFAID